MTDPVAEIFISYDRQDAGGWTTMLYDKLTQQFGEDLVFRDRQSILSGTRWSNEIERNVRGCRAFILTIGPDWRGERVMSALQREDNWVRREVELALEADKHVFPVRRIRGQVTFFIILYQLYFSHA